jgi:transcription elongation GreA/GreB family factor
MLRYGARMDRPRLDKHNLLDRLRERVEAQLDAMTSAQATVQSGAIHEENRQEHPKDTRAIEAQYLARGLAERVETMREIVAALTALEVRTFDEDDPIALSAVVALEDDGGERSFYFLVPRGGGETLDHETGLVYAVTPEAPVGQALVGCRAGEEVELRLPRGTVRQTVVWVL